MEWPFDAILLRRIPRHGTAGRPSGRVRRGAPEFGELGPQRIDLRLERAGIDRHLDALFLRLGELKAKLGILRREFEQGDVEGGQGDGGHAGFGFGSDSEAFATHALPLT